MKLPSLSSLWQRAGRTFLRFPLAILLAVAATAISITLVQKELHEDDNLFIRCGNAIISCYLGMLLSISATVWAERRAWKNKAALGLQVIVLMLTVIYYFMMPDHMEEKTVIRWVLYALGLHWLIAVAGFMGSTRINGFWQFNKKLFLRIFTSLLYTAVLYIGLCLALIAIDHLFDADLSYKWYMDVWLALIGLFNTWFFLAGFPEEYEDTAVIADYPKGLKIFTQYILLPILTVYMVILYVYLFKIVFTAHWPVGWVSYLVLGFSVAGILALLLIYPLRDDDRNKWINGYSRFFYFALFPLLILLGFAIWKRVAAYGITELRYFVLMLAGWLLCIAVYFLRSRKKNILVIPLSLCILAFLSSLGPWGVFNVSRYSQQQRLKGLLIKYGLFADGRMKDARVKVPSGDRKEISSIVEYIVGTHGYQPLQPWFSENLDSMMRKESLMGRYEERERAQHIMTLMHLAYVSRYEQDDAVQNFNCRLNTEDLVLPTAGYSYVLPRVYLAAMSQTDAVCEHYRLGNDSLVLCLDSTNQLHLSCTVSSSGGRPKRDSSYVVGLDSFLQTLPNLLTYHLELSPEKMTLPINVPLWKGQLIIREISGAKRDNALHVDRLEAYVLIGRVGGD